MDLVRDLVDALVVDRNGREMGRVDRLVLRVPRHGPPTVVALELGPAALADRVHPVLGRWVSGLEHALGVDEGRPVRISVRDIIQIDDRVKVDVAFGETAAGTVERWLRRWVGSIPRTS